MAEHINITKVSLAALLVLIVSYCYPLFLEKLDAQLNIDEEKGTSVSELVDTWKTLINSPKQKKSFQKIAIGVNGDVDLILRGTELLKTLNPESANSTAVKARDHAVISTVKELDEIFTLFMSKGGGGERYFSDQQQFEKVIEATSSLKHIKKYIGGNAALMAEKMLEINKNLKVMVGVPVGPVLRGLLNPNLQLIQSDTTKLAQDEYHVVLEYSKGEKWNGQVAPSSSRFIFSHDVSNSRMSCMSDFVSALATFDADLVVVSGLHMLEGLGEWEERLEEVRKDFDAIPNTAAIHIELASMADPVFVRALLQNILPLVDSIGLNEQELWLVAHAMRHHRCAHVTHPDVTVTPDIAAELIGALLRHLSATRHNNRMTRVHFHTLAYHVIATVDGSAWWGDGGDHQMAAVSAGALQAATQACDGAPLTTEHARLGIPRNHDDSPVRRWSDEGVTYHMTSSLVCRHPSKTVGLGDAISASGLLHSAYTPL